MSVTDLIQAIIDGDEPSPSIKLVTKVQKHAYHPIIGFPPSDVFPGEEIDFSQTMHLTCSRRKYLRASLFSTDPCLFLAKLVIEQNRKDRHEQISALVNDTQAGSRDEQETLVRYVEAQAGGSDADERHVIITEFLEALSRPVQVDDWVQWIEELIRRSRWRHRRTGSKHRARHPQVSVEPEAKEPPAVYFPGVGKVTVAEAISTFEEITNDNDWLDRAIVRGALEKGLHNRAIADILRISLRSVQARLAIAFDRIAWKLREIGLEDE